MTTIADIELKEKDVLAFTCGYEMHRIPFIEIIYLEAAGSYTYMYTAHRRYIFSRHIGFIKERYFKERTEFLQARDSVLVNRFHIIKYASGICFMMDGSVVQVARRRKSEIKRALSI